MRSPAPWTLRRLAAAALFIAAPLAAWPGARAENVLEIPDQRVTPGQREVWFPVVARTDDPIQGFQVMATFDSRYLRLTGHSFNLTVTSILRPEFVRVLENASFVEVGVIFDFLEPFDRRRLPPQDHGRIIHLLFDVAQGAALGSVTHVALVNDREISNVFNILTVEGFSVLPRLEGSTVFIQAGTFFLRGDVDNNGALNINDPVFLLNFLFLDGPEPRCIDAGDFTDKGTVDISSPVAELNFLFLGGRPPAVPFPNLGQDPTPDNLRCR
jgi:hypothetical protein